MGTFSEKKLRIPTLDFGSELAEVIVSLEKLREKRLSGTAPMHIFVQLRDLFQILESIGSARIEGNRTTVIEYAEKIISGNTESTGEESDEIKNMELTLRFINENVKKGSPINRALISEIHKTVTRQLTREGSKSPGSYRMVDVSITKSEHTPPSYMHIPELCDELFTFINDERKTQFHLLAVAIAHHRFTWIHPYDNGNGRTVRMLTYAQLIQQGFQVKANRILNPTAIFCIDREEYYRTLSMADNGTDEGLRAWCLYVLRGLQREIEKIDSLLDRVYLQEKLFIPMLARALNNQYVTKREHDILTYVVLRSKDMTLQAKDLKGIVGDISSVQRSRIIAAMLQKKILVPVAGKQRTYTISFMNNYLLREVVAVLHEQHFIPDALFSN